MKFFKDQLYKDLDNIYYYDDLYNYNAQKILIMLAVCFLTGVLKTVKVSPKAV